MEDIFKFLLVAGILIYGFIKQARKEAPEEPAFPYPEMPDSDEFPMPEEISMPQDSAAETARETAAPPDRQDSPRPPRKKAGKYQPIQETGQAAAATPANEPEATSDFGIRSTEDARRAVIWSEILKRKY